MRASRGLAARVFSISSMSRTSQSASGTSPFSTIGWRSRARSSGMVATTIPPALMIAMMQATIIGVLAERTRTRPPGTRPSSRVSTSAIRFTRSARSA